MILSQNCNECIYGYTVTCASGDEYICCPMKKCQDEKKEVVLLTELHTKKKKEAKKNETDN